MGTPEILLKNLPNSAQTVGVRRCEMQRSRLETVPTSADTDARTGCIHQRLRSSLQYRVWGEGPGEHPLPLAASAAAVAELQLMERNRSTASGRAGSECDRKSARIVRERAEGWQTRVGPGRDGGQPETGAKDSVLGPVSGTSRQGEAAHQAARRAAHALY